MKLNPYRKQWSQWLPSALDALAKDPPDYGAVMPQMPLPLKLQAPLAHLRTPMRLALFTSSGAYDARLQAPFAASAIVGDATHRVLDANVPDEAIAFAHEHFDHTPALQDRECVIPRRTLAALGVKLAAHIVSWTGYLLDWPTFIEATVPQMVARVHADGANAALLVPI